MSDTVTMPAEMTPEMENVWRGAFIEHAHKRSKRFAKAEVMLESAEQVAYRALVKHVRKQSVTMLAREYPHGPRQPKPEPVEVIDYKPEDLIEGPRISLRYGSAATQIDVPRERWRITGRLSRAEEWRSIHDYTNIDCLAGKKVLVNATGVQGVCRESEEEGGGVEVIHQTGAIVMWGAPSNELTVIASPDHLNMFERAIKAHFLEKTNAA